MVKKNEKTEKTEKNKVLNIEDSLKSLDKIILDMESDKCTIEKSIELYEKGMKILNDTSNKIEKIEKDLKIIGK